MEKIEEFLFQVQFFEEYIPKAFPGHDEKLDIILDSEVLLVDQNGKDRVVVLGSSLGTSPGSRVTAPCLENLASSSPGRTTPWTSPL